MAELRNAQSTVESLAAHIEALRKYEAGAQWDDEEAVGELQATMQVVVSAVEGDVHATMEKFRERTKMVDPVTNEPRFGPKTMAKVAEMLEKYEAIRTEVLENDLLPGLRRRIESMEAAKAEEARRIEELHRRRALEEAALRQQQEEERRREEEEKERSQQREREAEQQRVAELARLAQQKREARERQRLDEEAKAQAEQDRLAHENAAAEVGLEGLRKAVDRLREGLAGDAALLRTTMQKLHVLVANICSSPENGAFRHIPKDNAHFHEDIGRHDGGHACLLALGFKELEPEQGRRVFILEEPDLSDDFDKWSDWFDGLKQMKEWVETQL